MNPAETDQHEAYRPGRVRAGEYRCLDRPLPRSSEYRICTLRERDIQSVRIWRNAQMGILRQSAPISSRDQERYYAEIVRPSFSDRRPKLILLSFLCRDSCIGYTGLTNIDWQAGRAEISFLLDSERVDDPATYRRDFTACLGLLSFTAFEILDFHRLFAETFDVRPLHVEILESEGYTLEGRLRDHASVDGRRVDSLVHGLLGSDWRARSLHGDPIDPG